MKKQIARRDFIKSTAIATSTTLVSSCVSANLTTKQEKGSWKKCALHSHTLWSDGQSLPEVAITEYKKRGFDMLVMTEHNGCPDDPHMWMRVIDENIDMWPPILTIDEYNRTKKAFKNSLITKFYSYKTFVRLKTFPELKKEFEEPNKFLLAGGEEITTSSRQKDGTRRDCHLNVFNVEKTFLQPKTQSPSDCIKKCVDIFNNLQSKSKRRMFMMLNHPFWRLWDVLPDDVLQNPAITHFEICNNSAQDAMGDLLSPDKFWDVILANRIEKKQGVIYATASDDTHVYDPKRVDGKGGINNAWTMALVKGEFTVDNTLSAIADGNCYPTTGVLLKSFEFDYTSKTLKVEVDAKEGVNYRIEFITTKRGFDHTYKTQRVEPKDKKLARDIPIYSDEIGKVVKSVNGTSASYKMAFDDLYIRAKIVSDKPTKLSKIAKVYCFPKYECAWTQPFANA